MAGDLGALGGPLESLVEPPVLVVKLATLERGIMGWRQRRGPL